MMTEIAIPDAAAERIRANYAAMEKQQVAFNNFVEGIAAGLDVPMGWLLNMERMVWCMPEKAQPIAEAGEELA